MKLSDVMGAADLSIYAQVGLVLFMLVFIAVLVRVLSPGRRQLESELVNLPFSDECLAPAPLVDEPLGIKMGKGDSHV